MGKLDAVLIFFHVALALKQSIFYQFMFNFGYFLGSQIVRVAFTCCSFFFSPSFAEIFSKDKTLNCSHPKCVIDAHLISFIVAFICFQFSFGLLLRSKSYFTCVVVKKYEFYHVFAGVIFILLINLGSGRTFSFFTYVYLSIRLRKAHYMGFYG